MQVTDFLSHFDDISEDIRNEIGTAVTFVCKHQGRQVRDSGELYLEHIFDVTYQLVQIGCDKTTILAGCLHDVIEDTEVDFELVEQLFGKDVALIVSDNSKRPKECFPSKEERLAEFHLRFLKGVSRDVRTAWPKLADRNHNLATLHGLHNDPSKQQRVAHETLDFYVPFLETGLKDLIPKNMEKYRIRYHNRLYHLAMAYLDPASA